MPYRQDLTISARRHLKAAQVLCETDRAGAQPGGRAVAGYLFGLAGEIAVKQIMRASGMKELPHARRWEDPFYAHFPELKTYLAKEAGGRRADELRQLAENPRLFQHWDTKMRYASTADIKDEWVASWRESAERMVEKMGLV